MSRTRASFAAIAVAAVLAVGVPGVAEAAPAQSVTHCGTNVSTGQSACFETSAEVTAWATSVGNRARGASADVTAAATSFLLGEIYQNANYGGSSHSFFGATACNGNHSNWDYQFGTLNDFGWNDKISSFKSFSNCYTKLWENANYAAGSTYGPYGNSAYVGAAMNDQASSIRWY